MEKINAKAVAKAVTVMRTSPGELRDVANYLEAAASNGNALPGQVVHYDATANNRFEWDPEITFEKFIRSSQSWLREPNLEKTLKELDTKAEEWAQRQKSPQEEVVLAAASTATN